VLRNDGMTRVTKAFKFHHPSFRTVLCNFIEAVIEHSFEVVEVSKLINLCICEVTTI